MYSLVSKNQPGDDEIPQSNYFSKDITFCGNDKENCVANQTLKDESCLVPCEGLYADIADDSLRQNTVKGL